MKHTLVCFIFLTALQDGNTGLVKAQTLTHRAEEGGNITVECSFYLSGSRKLFCKEKCEKGNILVETSDDAAQNGRYSIKYKKTDTQSYIMYVSITQLKQSDSGRYRCSLGKRWWTDGNDDFELIVTEASTTSTPNGTLRPFSASVFLSSASTPPTTQSLSSTSGSSTPSSASSGSSDVLIYVGLILVVMIVVLSAALLIFYMKRKTTKPRGPVETDTEVNRLYEEIRECDIPSRSPPVEVSSVYDYSKGPRSGGDGSGGIYSLVTSAQNNAEDNSHSLCYSEVDFSHSPDTNGAPCGNTADVVYSMSSEDFSTTNHTKDASPPLYSTVTSV
ncbi:hypothetical protein ACER0C_023634 [Sarotherodon galilaeus]